MADPVHEQNNFDFLRLLAASLVIFSHCFAIIGLQEPNYQYIVTLGNIGLYIFFIISGFLVTQSWVNTRSTAAFLWKRFLRIFPGLFFASVVTTFIIGILVTSLPPLAYLTDLQTYRYFFLSFCFPFWLFVPLDYLPGVFNQNPMVFVNGPLWTLVWEWGMYVLLLLLGVTGLLRRRFLLASVVAGMVLLFIHAQYISPVSGDAMISFYFILFLSLAMLFFISSGLFFFQKGRPFSPYVFAAAVAVVLLSSMTAYFLLVLILVLPYIVLFFAHLPVPGLNRAGRYGDCSYGMYIFAWPVQQTILVFFAGIPVTVFILLSFLITYPVAQVSWHLVESKALARKKDVPDIGSFIRQYAVPKMK